MIERGSKNIYFISLIFSLFACLWHITLPGGVSAIHGIACAAEASSERQQQSGGRPPALLWKHNTTKDQAVLAIKNEIQKLGYAGYVRWNGDEARARVVRLFIKIIDLRGRVTDNAVVLERCRGAAAGTVLSRCRAVLQRIFPGGEVLPK